MNVFKVRDSRACYVLGFYWADSEQEAKESRWCDEVQIIEVATGNRVL